jgi:hypothetical protein
MKDGSIQELTFYLGAKLKKMILLNGAIAWGMSSRKYVNAAVQNVHEYLATSAGGQTLKKNATAPFPVDYHPEMDATPELSPAKANYYQTQIGVLRWCVELGRIDIVTVPMDNGIETFRSLHYKLRMLGVPLIGPCYVYGGNMSVIHNTQRPESMLKNKSNSICYNVVRESAAMGKCIMTHVRSENNPGDMCTKVIPAGMKRCHLDGMLLFDLCD